jgi:hypothetical protein
MKPPDLDRRPSRQTEAPETQTTADLRSDSTLIPADDNLADDEHRQARLTLLSEAERRRGLDVTYRADIGQWVVVDGAHQWVLVMTSQSARVMKAWRTAMAEGRPAGLQPMPDLVRFDLATAVTIKPTVFTCGNPRCSNTVTPRRQDQHELAAKGLLTCSQAKCRKWASRRRGMSQFAAPRKDLHLVDSGLVGLVNIPDLLTSTGSTNGNCDRPTPAVGAAR